jgi:hypothetical protein
MGAWSPSTGYAPGNAVAFQGSSYVALEANSGANPSTAAVSWTPLALSGTAGATGPTGPAGLPGVHLATAPGGSSTGVLTTTATAVATLSGLPAGTYVVTGSTTIVSTQALSDQVQCSIEANGLTGPASAVGLSQPFALTMTPTPQTITVSAGTFSAHLFCSCLSASSTGYSFSNAWLMATQVGNVATQ